MADELNVSDRYDRVYEVPASTGYDSIDVTVVAPGRALDALPIGGDSLAPTEQVSKNGGPAWTLYGIGSFRTMPTEAHAVRFLRRFSTRLLRAMLFKPGDLAYYALLED